MWLRLTAKLVQAIGDGPLPPPHSSRFPLVDISKSFFLPRKPPRLLLDGEKLSGLSYPFDRRRPEGAEKGLWMIPRRGPRQSKKTSTPSSKRCGCLGPLLDSGVHIKRGSAIVANC
jgi:hypothetical protein